MGGSLLNYTLAKGITDDLKKKHGRALCKLSNLLSTKFNSQFSKRFPKTKPQSYRIGRFFSGVVRDPNPNRTWVFVGFESLIKESFVIFIFLFNFKIMVKVDFLQSNIILKIDTNLSMISISKFELNLS